MTIDRRTIGRLETSIQHLAKAVNGLTTSADEIKDRISSIENKFVIGRGALFGLIAAAGLAGYYTKEAISALSRSVLP
jgi:hypothetical protein